jgi:hypothetical protein
MTGLIETAPKMDVAIQDIERGVEESTTFSRTSGWAITASTTRVPSGPKHRRHLVSGVACTKWNGSPGLPVPAHAPHRCRKTPSSTDFRAAPGLPAHPRDSSDA